MKQRFPNSSCIGDHYGTTVFAITTFLNCETSAQKIIILDFVFQPLHSVHSTVNLGLC